jgi:hypothetical protein
MLLSFDPLFSLLVIIVLGLPYLVWVIRADMLGVMFASKFVLPNWPAISDLGARATHGGALLAGLLLSMAGLVVLVVLNTGWFDRNQEEAPIIYRPPVDPLARHFVYFFAIGPALACSFISGLLNFERIAAGAGVVLLMSGLAAVVATGDLVYLRRQKLLRSVWAAAVVAPALAVFAGSILMPWVGASEVSTSLPATSIAHFFGDSFERRTNQRLRAVTGDAQLASLITLDKARPHLFLQATPERTPWLNMEKFVETGGVVVWRASDTAGAPPQEIAKRFPDLVPEVPQSFDWLVTGRQPLLRIGWGIVRPKAR